MSKIFTIFALNAKIYVMPLNNTLEEIKQKISEFGNNLKITIQNLNIEKIPENVNTVVTTNPVVLKIRELDQRGKIENRDPYTQNEYGRTRIGIPPGLHLTNITGHKPHAIKNGGDI